MKKILAALAATCALTVAAHAADVATPAAPAWFVKLGATGTWFGNNLVSTTNPAITSVAITNNWTGTIEAGRYLSDNVSVSLFGGYPPTSTLSANNGGVTFGTATAGFLSLQAQYHFGHGAFRPYIGAGGAYNITFSTAPNTAGGITSLSVDNGFAPLAQVGVDIALKNNIGVFVDVKQQLFTATARTNAGSVQAGINPTVVTAGIGFNF